MVVLMITALLGACAVTPARRTFPDSPERIRDAVKKVLASCQNVVDEGEFIRTGNCPSPMTPGVSRIGRWRERHEVKLEGSTVEVYSVVEEGTGRHGIRWERRSSRPTSEAVLDAIAQTLMEDR